MRSALVASLCRTIIVSLLFLSYQSTAGMIGTDRAAGVASAQDVRAQIDAVLARAEVSDQLQMMGIDPKAVQARVAVLTDDEARDLAGKLHSVPAGASGGWAVAILVLVIMGFWWWYRNLR
ncbi:MAG TPA: PA2779 family protein [Burkholderiales bacterium]